MAVVATNPNHRCPWRLRLFINNDHSLPALDAFANQTRGQLLLIHPRADLLPRIRRALYDISTKPPAGIDRE